MGTFIDRLRDDEVREMWTDAVVAGSGPGGASVARDLAKQGKKVVILEQGKHHRRLGDTLAALLLVDKHGFLFSKEGYNVVRAITTGGSSVISCATAIPPPSWVAEKYGIDLTEYVQAARCEIGIKPLPDRLIGPAARRVMDAARDLGFNWNPLDKFIDAEKCDLKCPNCMLGCAKGAKWSARNYVEEAVDQGAILVNEALVEDILTKEQQAVGVRAITPTGSLVVNSKATVVAGGGLGTPVMLQRAGISEAGQGLFADPLLVTFAVHDRQGSWADIPMSAGTLEHVPEGFVLTDLGDPWANFLVNSYLKGWKYLTRIAKYRRIVGIMTKARDEIRGHVNPDGTFSKPFTEADRHKLEKGANIAETILKQAGADPHSIFSTPIRAAHPGGTARIGEVVDTDLETKIKNLYVCDTSVIPEPWGLPPVLTVIAFGKRLANSLASKL